MDSKDVVNNFISSQIYTNHQGLTQAENVDKSLKKVVDNLYAGKQETDAELATIGSKVGDVDNVDLAVADEQGKTIVEFSNGHIRTKEFNSASLEDSGVKAMNDNSRASLNIGDGSGNVLIELKDGHIKTKKFDSRDFDTGNTDLNYDYTAIGSKIVLGVSEKTYKFNCKHIGSIGWGNQGFCLYGDYALVFSNTGISSDSGSNKAAGRIYRVTDNNGTPSFSAVTEPFALGGYSQNHANTASLGKKYEESDPFPLMYMPRCIIGTTQNCCVERITLDGTSTKVQEISIGTYRGEVNVNSDIQWTTDGTFLYMFGNTKSSYSASGNKFVFCKLELPDNHAGDVSIDLNDAIEFYYFEDYGFHNTIVLQGCKVNNGMMILPVGFSNCKIHFWDIEKRRLKTTLDLASYTAGEFEDVDIYKNNSLLVFVGGGGVYQLWF